MGLLADLQNLLNEHGSASILKERLALFMDKVAKLEAEKRDFVEALADIQIQNTKLHKQLKTQAVADEFTEHRGMLFKVNPLGGYHQAVFCPSCRMPMGTLTEDMPLFCGRCDIQSIFNSQELPLILKELEERDK